MQKHQRRFPGGAFQQASTLQRHTARHTRIYEIQGIKILHEFDDFGNHRIIIPGDNRSSEWVNYKTLAQIKMTMGHIGGTTDYWSGYLPRVFLYITG